LGCDPTIYVVVRRHKNFSARLKQTSKKEGGLGEGIFARLAVPPWRDLTAAFGGSQKSASGFS